MEEFHREEDKLHLDYVNRISALEAELRKLKEEKLVAINNFRRERGFGLYRIKSIFSTFETWLSTKDVEILRKEVSELPILEIEITPSISVGCMRFHNLEKIRCLTGLFLDKDHLQKGNLLYVFEKGKMWMTPEEAQRAKDRYELRVTNSDLGDALTFEQFAEY